MTQILTLAEAAEILRLSPAAASATGRSRRGTRKAAQAGASPPKPCRPTKPGTPPAPPKAGSPHAANVARLPERQPPHAQPDRPRNPQQKNGPRDAATPRDPRTTPTERTKIVQINGTTLTKRQKALVSGALLREQTRVADAMRVIDMTTVQPNARDQVAGLLLFTIDEITTLIALINDDTEEHAK